jgi:outer membrane protein
MSVSLVLLGAGVQQGFAQQAAPASAQSTQTISNPTAPAAPQAVQNDTSGNPGSAAGTPAKAHRAALSARHGQGLHQAEASSVYLTRWHRTRRPRCQCPGWQTRHSSTRLLKDGKIYLSLSDAIALALENNFDIAIARINLDIADTDILRAKAGSTLHGVSTGIVANTLGRNDYDDLRRRRPGRGRQVQQAAAALELQASC